MTCQINNLPSGATTSNWQFAEGTNTVTPSTNPGTSWSGTAVMGGTVSVTATTSTNSSPLSAPLTVNARNWHTNPASPVQVPNNTFFALPVPPQPSGTDAGLGQYNAPTSDSGTPNSTIIGSGPNTGYAYFATQFSISTLFQYEINPDLADSTSVFSVHQCGNYNASTNPASGRTTIQHRVGPS